MLNLDLIELLARANKDLMREQLNCDHGGDMLIKIHDARKAISILIDPTYIEC